ncbi:hypothetical protein HAX54_032373, partial [Datura stramonium]|nr:hypothetical protein [Datura stramonium]
MFRNEIYDAARTYLYNKISPKTDLLKLSKPPKEKKLRINFAKSWKTADSFEGVELMWRFVSKECKRTLRFQDYKDFESDIFVSEKQHFELCFDKKCKDIEGKSRDSRQLESYELTKMQNAAMNSENARVADVPQMESQSGQPIHGSSTAYNVVIEKGTSEQMNDQEATIQNSGNTTTQLIQSGACVFTQSQYDHIVQLLNQAQLNTNAGCSTNIASYAPTGNNS